ncbi:MAG: hypothetical protein ACRDT6_13035 [Micromonosporaceae bacterium]
MMRKLYRAGLTGFVVLTLGGVVACGAEQQRPDAGKGSTPASAPPSESPSSTPGPSLSPQPDPSKPGKGGTVELRGTVESGVEHGCLIMTVGGKTYTLVGGDREVVKAGADVVVRGVEDPDIMTICQQGVPFRVTEAYAQ